eukprot:TRINITY_DN43588_c0_g2_i1.p2 TRINITY_DN43588_c0_g2~~TRINITY_DN43588_c0_g2_i1.p2  ORF type:complete len:150 (-),score=18.15 TRINITY_DN43588_c0_g2_i1:172-621(-)
MAFAEVGIELEFSGEGVDEVAKVVKCTNPDYKVEVGKEVISIDPRYFRPTEVELLIGDPAKMKEKLNWEPKYDLAALVKDMIWSDVELFNRDKYLKKGGHKILNYHEQWIKTQKFIQPAIEEWSVLLYLENYKKKVTITLFTENLQNLI